MESSAYWKQLLSNSWVKIYVFEVPQLPVHYWRNGTAKSIQKDD